MFVLRVCNDFSYLLSAIVLDYSGKSYLQMRLNKVSELIHNSTNHQNLESAGVSVLFQEIVDLVAFLNLVLRHFTYLYLLRRQDLVR